MKNKISFVLLILMVLSCSDDNCQNTCLPGPGGALMSNSLNVTVFTLIDNLEEVTLITSTGEEIQLQLVGYKSEAGKYFTDWEAIPDVSYESINVNIDGRITELSLGTMPSTNQIKILLEEENDNIRIELSKYEVCRDTTCS
jgi:hypothetical protein